MDVVKPQDSMDHILRMIKNICMSSPHYRHKYVYSFSSVAQSCPTLCDPMNHGSPGLYSLVVCNTKISGNNFSSH